MNVYTVLNAYLPRFTVLFFVGSLTASIPGTQTEDAIVEVSGDIVHPNDHRPNIVVIIADDISQDFTCYGGQVATPHIDALAKEGVLFHNAYVTASSCSPSRNSIITGRYPHNTGAPELHMDLPEGQFMFPLALRQAGYYTALSGKWHMGEATRPAFDLLDAVHYPDDYTGAENWIKILRERPQDRPFFMWFAAFDAHRPWEPDATFVPHDSKILNLPIGVPDTPVARSDFSRYCDEVRRFDSQVGRVVSELKLQNAFENTLIFILADNGRPFPRSKSSLYDGGMKTPLIVHWPNGQFQGGAVSDSFVSTIDLAPTILELVGLPLSPKLQGKSLMPICYNPEYSIREYIFGERNWHVQRGCGRMVRFGNWVYMRDFTPQSYSFTFFNFADTAFSELVRLRDEGKLGDELGGLFSPERPHELLFDVGKDPQQLDNVAGNPEHHTILVQMRLALQEWQSKTGDSIPDVALMTPDRHDPSTFKRLYSERRPLGGIVPGEQAGAMDL